MDASHVYLRALALGCFYSHINTRIFRRALTASLDSCAEIKSTLSVYVTKSGRVWRKVPESGARSVSIPSTVTVVFFIIGWSCHMYHFKTFVATKHVFCPDKKVFCRDKSMLAATKPPLFFYFTIGLLFELYTKSMCVTEFVLVFSCATQT